MLELIKARQLRIFVCEVSPYATTGEGFRIHHSPGIIIGHEVVIGENCEVFQNVTIGSNRKEKDGRFMSVIGDNVFIYTGTYIVGSIKIGNNSVIGANTYVDFNIPDNSFVCDEKGHMVLRRENK